MLFLIPVTCVLGMTADDLYSRATQKYLTGDLEGAESDLVRVLDLEPKHDKALELLRVVRKEMGKTPTPKPAPVVEPKPKPAPKLKPIQILPPVPEIKPIPKAIMPKIEKQTKVGPQELPPPRFTPQAIPVITEKAEGELEKKLEFWRMVSGGLGSLLFLMIIYLNYRYFRTFHSLQICIECKSANPGKAEFCMICGARLKPWGGVTSSQKKWYSKFGWRRNPFTLDIFPELFTGYGAQVDVIFEKIYQRSGHILVLGNKGVGKTILLKWLTETLKKKFMTVYLPRPAAEFDDLLEFVASNLKIKKRRGRKLTIYDLEAKASKEKKGILLFLDEAHEFSVEFERNLRSMGDLNGVNLILAGLLEARDKIKHDSPPFYDRIVQEIVLEHLTLGESRELMKKRIESVGGKDLRPFTEAAVEKIFKMSMGIPRMLLKVCDWVITDAIHNNLDVIGESPSGSYEAELMDIEEEKK